MLAIPVLMNLIEPTIVRGWHLAPMIALTVAPALLYGSLEAFLYATESKAFPKNPFLSLESELQTHNASTEDYWDFWGIRLRARGHRETLPLG